MKLCSICVKEFKDEDLTDCPHPDCMLKQVCFECLFEHMKLHKEQETPASRIVRGFQYERNSAIIKGQNNSFL